MKDALAEHSLVRLKWRNTKRAIMSLFSGSIRRSVAKQQRENKDCAIEGHLTKNKMKDAAFEGHADS